MNELDFGVRGNDGFCFCLCAWGIRPPDSFRHAFGVTPPSRRRFCLRRFAPENTFLDSRVRGNDEGGSLFFVVPVVFVVVTAFCSCLSPALRDQSFWKESGHRLNRIRPKRFFALKEPWRTACATG
ncbi:MAG: hypothetical protein LBI87_07745 [Candidatus Accumulibacter sp.]|nr:hypothetical protein [Accumulibacter sp.]